MWIKKIYKNGDVLFKEKKKRIYLHKAMNKWWVDYWIQGGNVKATVVPYNNKQQALRDIQQIKKEEFVYQYA